MWGNFLPVIQEQPSMFILSNSQNISAGNFNDPCQNAIAIKGQFFNKFYTSLQKKYIII